MMQLMIFLFLPWFTFGTPMDEHSCYPVEPIGFTCCNSIEFMRNEYGNCLRSDTKYVKVLQEIRGNDTCFKYEYFPYFQVELEEDQHGYINDYVMSCSDIEIKKFVPKSHCKIIVDKINSILKLESDSKMIALYKTDLTTDLLYFDAIKTMPLSLTCNNIEVFCGKNHKKMTFCHKHHLECINLLSSYYFPEKLSKFICPNLALIIFCLVLILVFKVSSFLIQSHFYLIIFPVYYPICLVMYYIYEKIMKSCSTCGKPYHPFYNCNLTCTCGAIFNSTETLKRHKTTQKCKYAKLPLVKSCLLNKVFQFLNNITLVIILFLMILPSINAIETHHFNNQRFKWEHKVKQYLNHLSSGLEHDGFHKVAGALKQYKNDKSVILQKGQDSVIVDLSVQTFETTKLTLKYNDKTIFQMGLTVERSSVMAPYTLEYTTGDVKHFKVEHDEICTGVCPNIIERKGWINFQKEATSYWGCEEFGCLAAGDGCVWGKCDDIIDVHSIGHVYKKATSTDSTKINVCIYMLNDGYCRDFSGDTLIQTGLKMQLINNDVSFLPPRVYIDKNKGIYTGEINSLGEYDSKCGQLQVINGTNFGKPAVMFDIICHTLARKDVKVRQCRETSHHSCKNLINIDEKGIKATYTKDSLFLHHNIKDGLIKFQLNVAPYIQIAESMDDEKIKLSVTGSCSGCIGCALGINCLLQITSNMNTMCKVTSDVVILSLEHLVLSLGTHTYNIITYLNHDVPNSKIPKQVQLKICDKEYNLAAKIKIDTNSLEDAFDFDKTTLDIGDAACKTALCSVFSGLSGLFGVFNGLGSAVKITVTIIIFLLIVYILSAVFIPLIRSIHKKIKNS